MLLGVETESLLFKIFILIELELSYSLWIKMTLLLYAIYGDIWHYIQIYIYLQYLLMNLWKEKVNNA